MVLAEPGALDRNLTLGSSCPTYQPLSTNRLPFPSTTLIGSVHRSPASFLTVLYALLQPLQSSSLVAFGATVPAASAVLAVVDAPAMAALPARPSSPARQRRPLPEPCRRVPPFPGNAHVRSFAHACRQPHTTQARRSRQCDRPAIRDAFRTKSNNHHKHRQ